MLSHKMYVADIKFVPNNFTVDRRNISVDGKHTHFLTCSEDGTVNIWDSRNATKEALKKNPEMNWNPFL